MRRVVLKRKADLAEWRAIARALLLAGTAPEQIDWSTDGAGDLFGAASDAPPPPATEAHSPADRQPKVPGAFMTLAAAVVCHSDPSRFALLYRVLWRLQADPRLLDFKPDPDVQRLYRMEKSVRRDCHKMTAFVRFRELPAVPEQTRRRFIAWFEPDHHIVERIAPFFAARFGDMDWLILTPKGSASFDAGKLATSDESAAQPQLEDEAELLWTTYFAAIFNPARLKVKAMQAEMPKKYWRNLPEAALIPAMIAGAEARAAGMAEQMPRMPPVFHQRIEQRRPAPAPVPELASDSRPGDLAELNRQAAACTRCPLHCNATQTVLGEGPADAQLMIVGEQPGDQEDLSGRPFSGPAGRMLDTTLAGVGLDRRTTFVTNAVKHFKFEARGKRRIHQRPDSGEIQTCRWWLDSEIALVKPKLILAMGATSVESLTGARPRMKDIRGTTIPTPSGIPALVTWHPAYLLRLPDANAAAEATAQFHQDIARAASSQTRP